MLGAVPAIKAPASRYVNGMAEFVALRRDQLVRVDSHSPRLDAVATASTETDRSAR